MTSLVVWQAVDSRGPSALYIAADSRLTWGDNSSWNFGRKLFRSAKTPDIFGYSGDVLFPFVCLNVFVELIGIADWSDLDPDSRHRNFIQFVSAAFDDYPAAHRASFSLVHGCREENALKSVFHCWALNWSPAEQWSDSKLSLPTESGLIASFGSGKPSVFEHQYKWRESSIGRTSRAVFGAFCESLNSGEDVDSGGAPQLVGLYRTGTGEHFGVIHKNGRYLGGLLVTKAVAVGLKTEWRNELFERCDADSMSLLRGAQRHARPHSSS